MANKTLGQHWLYDKQSLAAMVEAADLGPDDFVLEVGPGHGTLTQQLIKHAAMVRAVEFDADLAKSLSSKVPTEHLQVEQADIRKYDFTQLPEGYKIVANIPYYLTSYLLRQLIDTTNKPARAVLLVQKEVAKKVAEVAGGLSLLAALVQIDYEVGLGPVVEAALFLPPPRVDSQVLCLRRKAKLWPETTRQLVTRLMKHGFSNARKTIENNLASGLAIDKTIVRIGLQQADVAPARRAESLSLEDWCNLVTIFEKYLTR